MIHEKTAEKETSFSSNIPPPCAKGFQLRKSKYEQQGLKTIIEKELVFKPVPSARQIFTSGQSVFLREGMRNGG
jgi:hypothetical protein